LHHQIEKYLGPQLANEMRTAAMGKQ
jgi:hypothetical protein